MFAGSDDMALLRSGIVLLFKAINISLLTERKRVANGPALFGRRRLDHRQSQHPRPANNV